MPHEQTLTIRRIAAAGALALVLALASCTAPPTSADPGAGSGSETAASTPAATPVPTAAVPAPTAPPAAASCTAIDTTAATVDGTTLGTCISDALHVLGTAKAHAVIGGEVQDAEFRLRPDVAIHGTSPRSEVIYVDGVAYRNEGAGWVKGDPDSADSDEAVIGSAGLLLLSLFTGDVLKQSIAACPVWNIEVAPKRLTLPDGQVVETRVFTCAAPFESFGTTVSPMSVWIGEDWTPYGSESTATGFGQVIEGTQYFYDHGAEVDITAPM